MGRAIKDQNNNIVAAITTIKDITKIKELADKFNLSELTYRNLLGFKISGEKPQT